MVNVVRNNLLQKGLFIVLLCVCLYINEGYIGDILYCLEEFVSIDALAHLFSSFWCYIKEIMESVFSVIFVNLINLIYLVNYLEYLTEVPHNDLGQDEELEEWELVYNSTYVVRVLAYCIIIGVFLELFLLN